jgi:bifunctional DNase/RNase
MPVRMELARILIRETDDTHIVELRETEPAEDEARVFPIVIGLNEAAAIERRLVGADPLRPQTHELLSGVIEKLGYRLERVVINDLQDHTFFARLHLRPADTEPSAELDPDLTEEPDKIDVDSRPSDALAISVAHDAPIWVEQHVLDAVWSTEA